MGRLGRALGGIAGVVAPVLVACGGSVTGTTGTSDGPPKEAGAFTGGDASASAGDGGIGSVDGSASDGGALDGGPSRLKVGPVLGGAPTIFDTKRGVSCLPQSASDGTVRCLPTSTGSVSFTDAACAHAVVDVTAPPPSCGPPAPPPTYFANAASPNCKTGVSIYVAGAPLDAGAALYGAYGTYCYVTASYGTFREAVESPPSDWVELKSEVVPVTDRLGVAQWKSADGAVIFDGLRLLPGKDPCDTVPPIGNANSRCIPTAQAIQGDVWANDQCTGSSLAARECRPARLVYDGASRALNDPFVGLYEIGSTVDTGYVNNTLTNWQCLPVPPNALDPYYFYTEGAPLVPSDYPPLATKVEGSGRLQTEYVTSESKNLYANSYYDTKFGKSCTPQALTNGGTWCVPNGLAFVPDVSGASVFADAQCTIPLGQNNSGAIPTWTVTTAPGTCAFQNKLVAAIPHKGPVYQPLFLPSDGGSSTCEQVTISNSAFYEAGAPLDPSTLFVPLPPVQ